MRIAIDIRSLMEGRHSGVQQYTIHIIEAMLRVAPEHEYHLFYNSARPVSLPDFGAAASIHGFRYPNKLLNLSQWLLNWPKWDMLVYPEPGRRVPANVFFVPGFRLMPLSAGQPIVATVHDLSYERFPEFWDARRRVWHTMMRPRELMRGANHLIAVSEHTASDVQQLYNIPAERVSVIYSGVTSEKWVPTELDRIRVRKKYHLPTRFILYFGTLEPRKNIPGVIRAYSAIAKEVPQDLVIAGARGWRTQDIDTAAAQSAQSRRIHFPGFVAEEDKAALYAAADLFVYPSFYEGFGFPPLEALLAGTPVITSFNSSLPEVVGQWATLVNPYDTSELALVMKELLNDLPDVPASTRTAIQEKYSWDRAARQTLEVITKAV